MCGRTAQSVGAVMAASSSLSGNPSSRGGGVVDKIGPRRNNGNGDSSSHGPSSSAIHNQKTDQSTSMELQEDGTFPWHDNYNMSPGHDAVVFTLDKDGKLQMDRKIWGLVSKGGTSNAPLPEGSSKHFANLMFNARSDTLFSKPTFSRLLGERKTCLVAFDGFFEWKTDPLGGGKGKKQPYFVFRNNKKTPPNAKDWKEEEDHQYQPQQQQSTQTKTRPYLLMAGLWTSVPTGYAPPQPATLDTFTVLTTEVCDPLKWLHSRMPVCVWDEDLAWKWLLEPSQKIHEQIDQAAVHTEQQQMEWHAVTTQMSSVKYRNADSIKALPKPRSVKAFFAPIGKATATKATTTTTTTTKKPSNSDSKKMPDEKASSSKAIPATTKTRTTTSKRTAPSSPVKKPAKKKVKQSTPDVKKKGSIASFFSPKPSRA